MLLHPNNVDGVHQAAKDNGVNQGAKEQESERHLNKTTTKAPERSASSQSDDTTTASTVIEASVERHAASTTLSVGEKYHLSKILAALSQDKDNTQTPEETKEASNTCKDSPLSSPFLLQLATAAATAALESKTLNQAQGFDDSTSVSFDPNDDNPQAMIQLLLEEAKRQEALQQTEKQHLGRVKTISSQGSVSKLVLPLETVLQTKSQFTTTIYLSIVSVLLGYCEPKTTLDFLWKALDSDNGAKPSVDDDKQKVYSLMELCFYLALAHSFLTCPEDDKKRQIQLLIGLQQQSSSNSKKDPAIQALHQSFLSFLDKQPQPSPEERHKLFLDCFLAWHDRHVPSMLSTMSVCMREILFPSFSYDDDDDENASSLQNNDGWAIPSLDRDEGSDNMLFSSSSLGALSSWQFIMACTMPPCQHEKVGGVWHRLYSTHSEGFNLSTLEHSLAGYHGPTLMLVEALDKESQTNQTFGAFASRSWIKQEGPDFYGDSDSFLFQLGPKFKVARAETEQSQQHRRALPNYQYFYLDNSSLPTPLMKDDPKQHESGIGLGGSRRRPRFFVAASLDHCYLGDSDATFQDTKDDASIKMIHPFWDLHVLEVWGLGGDAAMKSLQRHQIMEEAQLQQARQVDKAAFLNDFRSGLIESKMFAFHDDIRNRDGGCLLDCHDEGDDGRWQIGAPR